MITKRIEYKEEILPNQVIQLRTATVVEEDGTELGRSYHRCSYAPGSDVSEAPEEIKVIAAALWSDEVVAAYEASLAPYPMIGVENANQIKRRNVWFD